VIGIASVLAGTMGTVGRIRRIVGSVQSARREFENAGGGVRGAVAGVRAAVKQAHDGRGGEGAP